MTKWRKTGVRLHPMYDTWSSMKKRCYNKRCPDYENYGARGITVCDEWRENFILFVFHVTGLKGYEDRIRLGLTLDRIDVDGNYEPNNLRWATSLTQNQNTRKTKKNTSGFKNVALHKGSGKYRWKIQLNGKIHSKWGFKTAEECNDNLQLFLSGNGG